METIQNNTHPKILSKITEKTSKENPDGIAIKDIYSSFTFNEIENITNHLAHKMIVDFNVKKGDRVLIIAEKKCEIVIAVIATWKAGAVYVPVDKNNGEDRTKFIIENVNPQLIISTENIFNSSQDNYKSYNLLSYEEIDNINKNVIAENCNVVVEESDPAIILHTSGSTGNPKGVILAHKSVVNYFNAHNEILKFKKGSKNINLGPFHFDVSIQDTFLPLYFGAGVYIYNGLFISKLIIRLLIEEKATHLIAVSSVLALVTGVDDGIKELKSSPLKFVMTGGELCDTKLINKWFDCLPDISIYNGYGPTECNSLCMAYEINKEDVIESTVIPIGKPFTGTQVALIDKDKNVITEIDQKGILCISGGQLMSSYWNLPEQTEQAFITIDGLRHYITGDYAVKNAAGNYYFEGRDDQEVKILGRRINLNEIRNSLLKNDEVDYVVVGVITIPDANNDNHSQVHLYAYIYQSLDRKVLSKDDFVGHLTKSLPSYMIPKYFLISNELIKTASNKINEKKINELIKKQILAENKITTI